MYGIEAKSSSYAWGGKYSCSRSPDDHLDFSKTPTEEAVRQ